MERKEEGPKRGRRAGRARAPRPEATEPSPEARSGEASAPLAPDERRRRRREWGIVAVVAPCLALLFVFEGVVIARSRSLPIGSDAVFFGLVHLNVIGIGLLAFLLSRNVVKLLVDRRRGIIGSKLNTKFVVSFVFTAALSTTALFLLSAFLITHTLDTWFKLQLSDGLRESLAISEAYYEEVEDRLLGAARAIARDIESGGLTTDAARAELERVVANRQQQHDLGLVEVFSSELSSLARATGSEATIVALESADSDLIQGGLSGLESTAVLEAGSGELIRAVATVHAPDARSRVVGVVVVNRFLPRSVAGSVRTIRSALDSYQRLQPKEGPFQGSMLLLLGLLTLVSVLFSSWMGFRLAKQVTDPIQRLAGATRELAAGNLAVRVEPGGDDEIGLLVAAFNRMASDLQNSRADLERRRALMEVILGGAAAGVISLDASGAVTTVNPSALRLLGAARGRWIGHKPSEMLSGNALEVLDDLLRRLSAGPGEVVRRQVPIATGNEHRILNWTVSRLRDADGAAHGVVAMIDDVTQIVKGQRTAAWRDVARRIAHEIKNPLTPIQLAAQRMRRKLADHIQDPEGKQLLEQCTDAITGQVDAMKLLVTEFSNFAQLPATDPAPTDLNRLVEEAVAMYRGKPSIEFSTEVAADLPSLDVDREQIKRVILNLVDNAITSVEATGSGPRAIRVVTRFDRSVGTVHLEVADTGSGIRPQDRAKIFQPGFSTKADGSGIGLAIVSRIVSDHSGYIRVRGNQPRGTRFIVELPSRT